ncbi:MAG: hypothetical protein Q8R82_01995 [Hyphomonadaceae bacterium]|nr:hypothetical protein [Hyphomonadaceae bacterium]
MIWIVLGLIAVEIVGVLGLVIVLNGGLEQLAPIAVCVALIVVPILFGVALRSELKVRRKG